MSALLEVSDLRVEIPTEDGVVKAVRSVSFSLEEGKTLGIVGESGSGKSITALTLMGLTKRMGATVSGEAVFEGRDLLTLSAAEMRRLRGDDVAMIFQDPLASLHPFYRVGSQIVEAIQAHRKVADSAARARALELLELVGISDPERRLGEYPHEFSGGMRQRAMIAMALANEPKLLIADEPTTALDVTVQAQILALLERLQRELGMAIVIITHDLGVVAEMADEVGVMYAGGFVERAGAQQIFDDPQHPYTWGLLSSIPRLDVRREQALVPIPGRPPSLIAPPSGCTFHPRCPHARPQCTTEEPPLEPLPDDPAHLAACVIEPTERRLIWGRQREGVIPERTALVPDDASLVSEEP